MQVRKEVFDKSKGAQTPGEYNQLFAPVYLAGTAAAGRSDGTAAPAPPGPLAVTPTMTIQKSYGSLVVSAMTAGTLYLDGTKMGELPAGTEARLDGIEVGERVLELRYNGGEKETKSATVQNGASSPVAFNWKKPGQTQAAEATLPPTGALHDSIPRVGLVAEYLFNGDAKDTSGKGNNGGPANTKQGRGRFGHPVSSFIFDGHSSVIEVPHASTLAIERDYSISFWMNPDGDQQGAAIISKNTEGNDQFFVAFAYDNRIGMEQNNRDKWYYATIGFSVQAWNHICVVVKDDRISIYVNGVRDPRSPFDRIVGQKNSMPMLIGASGRPSGLGRFFSGLLDDIRVYDRALSGSEILDLLHEGGWTGT